MECTLDDDPRLIAGFGAIASAGAWRARLAGEDQETFLAAAIECCREAFALIARDGSRDSALHIAVASFPGCVEATIEYAGPAPASARSSLGECTADRSGPPPVVLPRGAGAQYETHDGRCRVTLTMHCAEVKAKSRE